MTPPTHLVLLDAEGITIMEAGKVYARRYPERDVKKYTVILLPDGREIALRSSRFRAASPEEINDAFPL